MKTAAAMLTLALSSSVPALAQQPATTAEVIDRFNQAFVRHDASLLEDLIADEDVVITISHMGYIKRTMLSEYRTQARGGKGAKRTALSTGVNSAASQG